MGMISLTKDKLLKIGEVSTQSGLPVKTIRYYEEIGLLAPNVERSDTGYRLFNPMVLSRLAFIKRSQSLGLTLNEVRQILQVHDQGDLPCHEAKQHIQGKVEAITQQIEALEALRAELQSLLLGWQEMPPAHLASHTICPNIQAEDPVKVY